jgi:hypothetical protein
MKTCSGGCLYTDSEIPQEWDYCPFCGLTLQDVIEPREEASA